MPSSKIKLFQNQEIRTIFNPDEEKWYFSVIDIIFVLTDSNEPRRYWSDLKIRLNGEGSQLYDKIVQLKMLAPDGKMRQTDALDMEQLFRLIQSIPAKKVEPLKLWLAQVGRERIDEEYDPEITINRALGTYRKKGYSDAWINQRLKSIEIRKEFTDELKNRGINSNRSFAVLTNILTQTWSGLSVKEYKKAKGLTKHNLRDHMSNLELILTQLAEATSTEISKISKPQGYNEVKTTVVKGASVAKQTRENIEDQLGRSIISSRNNKKLSAHDR